MGTAPHNFTPKPPKPISKVYVCKTLYFIERFFTNVNSNMFYS